LNVSLPEGLVRRIDAYAKGAPFEPLGFSGEGCGFRDGAAMMAKPNDNRRCKQIGLDEMFPGVINPFPWMAEMIDLKKEKNSFETRVTEYQTGGVLSWD
jgi:hypothetical protein